MSNSFLGPTWAKSALVCCFSLITSLTAGAPANETKSVSECMAFEQNALENGVEYRLVNHCEQRVSCSVAWTLNCGNVPPLRQVKGNANASIAPTAERNITASANACARDGWEITDVTWSCSP